MSLLLSQLRYLLENYSGIMTTKPKRIAHGDVDWMLLLFAQHQFVPEFYEMRLWIMTKLLEDPDRDVLALGDRAGYKG